MEKLDVYFAHADDVKCSWGFYNTYSLYELIMHAEQTLIKMCDRERQNGVRLTRLPIIIGSL